MKQPKEDASLKTGEKNETPLLLCPKCGRELKRMRCRIDVPELYCPACRLTLDPISSQQGTGV